MGSVVVVATFNDSEWVAAVACYWRWGFHTGTQRWADMAVGRRDRNPYE